ncbi:hypothetical protein Poli38472_004234 [Pythium oligandrum]|uniref:Uncharacterized protein n=1 Tax=Pythium oligandrum TaxID=41045 RepID=A0A8K1CNQ9_PYTOL|nr:hypothetical protein Poli38472_004234 [Pythium oligandrum]|eukprot:TMW66469.1 hypothetical protein Poli38472_004234 [Pythium oligandrum]
MDLPPTVKIESSKVLVKPLGEKRPSLVSQGSYRSPKLGRLPTPWQVLHITRRLLGLAAAIFFVVSAIESGVYGLRTLYGATQYDSNYGVYQGQLITDYVGTMTIKESRLFTQVFGGDSSLRHDAVYLLSTNQVSTTRCEGVANFNDWLYSSEYMRSNWHELVTQTSYNLTY